MKAIKTLCLSILMLCTAPLLAQSFEGKIVMKMEAKDLPPDMESMKSMFESTITVYSKGNRSRSETNQPMVGNVIAIYDMDKKESVTCMTMGDKKIAMKSSMDDAENDNAQNDFDKGTFNYTSESKMIVGHNCKKVIWTSAADAQEKMSMEFWCAEDIPATTDQFGKLKGTPLDYAMAVQGFNLHFYATDISQEKVADSMFEIPAGYEVKTQEEVQQMIPGGMGK